MCVYINNHIISFFIRWNKYVLMFLPYYSFPQKQLIDIHNMREDMTNILIASSASNFKMKHTWSTFSYAYFQISRYFDVKHE